MNRGQFLKSLGVIAGLAVAAPILEILPAEESAQITPEMFNEIMRLLEDGIFRDMQRRLWFGDPGAFGLQEGQIFNGCIVSKYEPFQ